MIRTSLHPIGIVFCSTNIYRAGELMWRKGREQSPRLLSLENSRRPMSRSCQEISYQRERNYHCLEPRLWMLASKLLEFVWRSIRTVGSVYAKSSSPKISGTSVGLKTKRLLLVTTSVGRGCQLVSPIMMACCSALGRFEASKRVYKGYKLRKWINISSKSAKTAWLKFFSTPTLHLRCCPWRSICFQS